MGTRHLIAVFHKGEYRIAQYGQWDGYPDGHGVDALEFARDRMKRPQFMDRLMKVKLATREDLERVDATTNWQRFFPQLSRDAGAKILDMVQDGEEGILLKHYIEFAGDSLMCEWAYVIDFDQNTFEVFRGFNKEPLDPSERFASQPLDHEEYKQVKFVKSWPLNRLPTNKKFLKALETRDEEEAA